jgi:hypothetical protein
VGQRVVIRDASAENTCRSGCRFAGGRHPALGIAVDRHRRARRKCAASDQRGAVTATTPTPIAAIASLIATYMIVKKRDSHEKPFGFAESERVFVNKN